MQTSDADKSRLLKDLFNNTYINDVIERNNVLRTDILNQMIDILASSVGSLTNPKRLHDTFRSNGEKNISINTINSYLTYLENAFVVNRVNRYDVKGRKYIGTPQKYYFSDIGLRNARLNFRQQEENHLMENIIYNELVARGYNVDVGVVELNGKNDDGVSTRKQLEVDFVCNMSSQRYYIQSTLNMSTEDKAKQEMRPLNSINDSFKKVVVVGNTALKPWHNDDGVLIISVQDFLLDKNSLDL